MLSLVTYKSFNLFPKIAWNQSLVIQYCLDTHKYKKFILGRRPKYLPPWLNYIFYKIFGNIRNA